MTFTDWIYKWFMRGHDSPPGTKRFTCPSSQLLLRSPDMLISEAPSSSARSSLPQNWVIDLPWLFIFRFEWHSREFFQLSSSNLYFLLFPETWHRGEERFWRYHSIFKSGTRYTALLSKQDGTAALLFFSSFLNLILHPLVGGSRLIYHPRLPLKPDFMIGTRR